MEAKKPQPWWRVPGRLTLVFGLTLGICAAIALFYGFPETAMGVLGILFVILVLIWVPAFIVAGIRAAKR